MQLTEKGAAISYARAWNRLDPEDFLSLLTERTVYESQWVFDKLVGVDAIAQDFRAKMQTVRKTSVNDSSAKVRAEIGTTQAGGSKRVCTYMQQGSNGVVIIFKVSNGNIERYDCCIPQRCRPDRSSVYPI